MFQAEKDAAGIAEGNGPTEWVVFRLTDITVPDFDAASAEAKRVAEGMRRQMSEDLIAQYVQRLQTDLGVTINQDALRRVAGGEQYVIEPAVEAFAARYARGEPQVVWTTLVADLETPVSAFLKVAGGAADELPARIGRRRRDRAAATRSSGSSRIVVWRANGASAEINRAAQDAARRASSPAPTRRSPRCAR